MYTKITNELRFKFKANQQYNETPKSRKKQGFLLYKFEISFFTIL